MLILDCDTGTDDAVAIMLAALEPGLGLAAVTTVNGNVPVDVVAENSLRVLRWVGRADIPVLRGAEAAIDRGSFPVPKHELTGFEMHGTYLDLPPSEGTVQDVAASDFLIAEARGALDRGEQITLVATGPLTNLARCVREFPGFVDAVRTLVVMGGGHALGNVTPSAEFNFWADPEAAKVVVGAGFRDLVLVPLDATHRALVSRADCAALRSLGTPASIATAQVIEQRIDGHDATQPMAERGTAPVHDALCIAFLIDPAVVTLVYAHVDVEVDGTLTVGRSVIDLHHRGSGAPNARVAVDADPALFVRIMTTAFAGP